MARRSRATLARRPVALALVYLFGLETTAFAHLRALGARAPVAQSQPAPSPKPAAARAAAAAPAPSSPIGPPAPRTALASTAAPAPAASTAPAPGFDLNLWTREGDPVQGAWHVAPDGGSVVQLVAAGPSFFVSPDRHLNTTVTGRLRVGSAGAPHQGSVGLVLGYRSPVASEAHAPNALELLLLDWRPAQGPRPAGFTLARVDGSIQDPAVLLEHAAPEVTVLAQVLGAGLGWHGETDYQLTVVHRSSRIQVLLGGALVLEAVGEFPEGRVGFYTHGQSAAEFGGFAASPGNTPPLASAGDDIAVTTGAGCAALVELDGSTSTDPDGDVLSYLWTGPFGSAQGVRPGVSVPVGVHTVTLTVDDGNGETASDTLQVSVEDATSPVLVCPPGLALVPEPGQCEVFAFDLGQPTAADGCEVATLTNDAPASFFQGTSQVNWSAADAAGNLATCAQSVVVADVVAPSVEATVAESSLWPPNHELVDVGLAVDARDACGAPPPATFLSVFSDEPDESETGDGDHPGDAVIRDGTVELRAERKGDADGRVYLLLVTASDEAGNESWTCRTVVVAKSPSATWQDAVAAQAAAAESYCQANGSAPDGFELLAEDFLSRPNRAPVVDAGPDQLLALPDDVVELAGTAVDDGLPPGSALAVSWSVASGPPGVVFADPASVVTDATLPGAGTYVLELTASDGELVSSDELTVTLLPPNQAPSVVAGPDQVIELPQDTASLAASADDDGLPLGSELAVAWSVASGPGAVSFGSPDALATSATFAAPGEYRLLVTVSDGELAGSDDVLVRLLPENQPPVVDAGPDRTIELPQDTVTLAGSVSDDGQPPGGSLSVSWTQVEGPAPVSFADPGQPATGATFTTAGSYRLLLTASDGALTAGDDVRVTVLPENQPPVVDAGPDREITLPVDTVTLAGAVSDDGLPAGSTLSAAWSQVSGPPGVVFADPAAPATSASFPVDGSYLLRLTADDGALQGFDEVAVVVNALPFPTVSIGDASVLEGSVGTATAAVTVALSAPSLETVQVGYQTEDGEAREPFDYTLRFGTVSFAPGETAHTVEVPVVGDLAAEGDETFRIRIGDPVAAVLGTATGTVTILDDDQANQPPSAPVLQPPDGSELFAAPALSWTAGDPEGGPLVYDVYFGTGFGTDGQSWLAHASAAMPLARSRAASGYDEQRDRLIVFGGRGAGGALADAWVLSDATGSGAGPSWQPLLPAGPGPDAREGATGEYDPLSDRLIVHGGCAEGCASAFADTWVLAGAGSGVGPQWLALPSAPDPRAEHVAGYDAATNRLIVFGGRAGGVDRNDVWILADANGHGAPGWQPLAASGEAPGPRHGAAGGYDARSNRLIVFGGRNAADQAFADVWVLENANGLGGAARWTRLAPTGTTAPAPRSGHTASYDPSRNRLVVIGGSTGGLQAGVNFVFQDAWVLTGANGLAGAPEWRAAAAPAPRPGRRLEHVAALSARAGRLVVALGENNRVAPSPLDDVWVLDAATGRLPLLSAGQPDSVLTPGGLAFAQDYLWQVVARDAQGAVAFSEIARFTLSRPRLAIDDVAVVEGDSGSSDAVFTVTLSGGDQPASVAFATADGTALAGEDYAAAAGSLDFPPGTLSRTVSIAIAGDVGLEADEAFLVRLDAPVGAELLDAEGVGTILNDDAPNQPPLVDAGPDRSITLPLDTLALAAAVADDGQPVGAALTLSWTRVEGPGEVSFSDPAAAATSATFTVAGAYTLRLTADDGALSASDDVAVLVASPDLPPDLVVFRVDTSPLVVDPQTLLLSGSVAAEIRNAGAGPAAGPFAVSFFEDRDGDGLFDPAADALLGVGESGGLAAGAVGVVAVTLDESAALQFQGNLIHGFVDSGDVVAESDETNNIGSSAAQCDFTPLSQDWDVQLEWSWTASSVRPDSTHVNSAPLVIDLDGDAIPEVVFVSNRRVSGNSVLRVLSGRDGSELFTVDDPALELDNNSTPVAGDIDLDGRPEIVAQRETGSLLAFEHDGTFKWESPILDGRALGAWGGLSLANLDTEPGGDPAPEIIAGRVVLNADGTIRWIGTASNGGDRGTFSIVADVDLDGVPEVVAGNTVYRADGSIYWENPDLNSGFPVNVDGLNALGNFDEDPFPEIVWVKNTTIAVAEHDGQIKWGPIELPGAVRPMGSPPVVADFDGDGVPEIGVAEQARYLVFEGSDGTLLWAGFTEENSGGNGSSAFDFDGDGAAELVYSDAETLQIRRGTDGVILFQVPVGHATAFETAITADVDGDGNAEVVAVSGGSGSIVPGVFVYGDAADHWALARPIWNQHHYHITNIDDDGTIPVVEAPFWQSPGSFRQQALVGVREGVPETGCQFARPDLTASFLRVSSEGGERRLTARVGNGGAAVALDVPVSYYDGDPALGGSRLGTVFVTDRLQPGRFADVVLTLPLARTTERSVWVVADDFGGLRGSASESDETNNAFDSGIALLPDAPGVRPDLTVTLVDVSGADGDWQTLELTGSVAAAVANQGSAAAGAFELVFFEDRDGDGAFDAAADNTVGATLVPGLAAGAATVLSVAATGSLLFRDSPIHVFADSGGDVDEAQETNNVGRSGSSCSFAPVPGQFDPRVEWSWDGSAAVPAALDVATTPVVADLTGDGIPDVVFASSAGSATGHLRAVSGRDGAELFTVEATAERVSALVTPAIGDIDGDGLPEIVAAGPSGQRLLAFESDGGFKWQSAFIGSGTGAITLADLDGDGRPEILFGRVVVDGDGLVLWTGARTSRGNGVAVVADLDLDGTPEVVLGNVAYTSDGAELWFNSAVGDGYTAVGNFDADDFPEIVVVGFQRVTLLEHTGELRWRTVLLPGIGPQAPPTVADLDGDGRPEILAPRGSELQLVETGGFLRWSVPVQHTFSIGGGAAAADLDGDGVPEVIHQDETGLHVYRGRDGALLASQPLAATCSVEGALPVVVDVDADGRAEVVAAVSSDCAAVAARGIVALGDAGDNWVGTRGIWNQHAYHVTNVADDATVPAVEGPSWLDRNSYREQARTEGFALAAADLTASFVRRAEDGTDLVFTVRIGNAGAQAVAPGVPVAVYNGDPRLGFPLLTTLPTTTTLRPGGFEDIAFRFDSDTGAEAPLVFVADDAGGQVGTLNECDEENNLHDPGFSLNRGPQVDVGPDRTIALPQTTLLLSAEASDDGLPLGGSLELSWGGRLEGGDVFPTFDPPDAAATTVSFFPSPGRYRITLSASDGTLGDTDELFVDIEPENQPPVVDAGPDLIVEQPQDTVTLAGSVQDDGFPGAGSLLVQWTQLSGPAAVVFGEPSSATSDVFLPETGSYVLRLSGDDGALSASADVTVTLSPPNQAPSVDAGPDETIFGPALILKGAVSDDGLPPGSAVVSAWSVDAGPGVVLFDDPADPRTRARFGASGSYALRLTADDGALSSSDLVTVSVDVTNVAPVVNAGPDQTILLPQTTAVLSGSASDDGLPLGSSIGSVWNLVAGPALVAFDAPNALTTTVTFTTPGSYRFSLLASDGELAGSDEVVVFVDDGNLPPVVDAGADRTLSLPNRELTLSAAVSDDGLPAAGSLSFAWSQLAGPAQVVFTAPNAATTTARFEQAGDYALRLTASDGRDSAVDDVAVSVLPGSAGPPPEAEILTPADTQAVTDFTDVIGSVRSDDLLSWRLELLQQGSEAPPRRVASGDAPVEAAVLGTVDPTLLLNGLYQLRLTATDNAGQSATVAVRIVVRDNLKIGNFTVSFVDLEVPLAGLPIRVTRTYDSREKRKRDFGVGWTLDVSDVELQESATPGVGWQGTVIRGAFATYCLDPETPHTVTVTLPDGRVHEFDMTVTPSCQTFVPLDTVRVAFRARPGSLGTLTPASGEAFVVTNWPGSAQLVDASSFGPYDPDLYRYTTPDGRSFLVHQLQGLQTLTDLNGNVLTVSAAGITHSSGRGIAFTRDGQGRITQITDPDGNPMTYRYDPAGDLVAYTDRELATSTYAYDTSHGLLDIVDPRGVRPIRNEYDHDGRLTRHIDAFDNEIVYQHLIGTRQEVIQDRNGDVRVLEYDERGNVVAETQPDGRLVLRSFDGRNNRLSETEPHEPGTADPPTTTFSYDANDNLLSTTDPLGDVTSQTYDDQQRVLTSTDARQKTTRNVYDARGNLLETRDPAQASTTFTYDAAGNVLTQEDAEDGLTRFEYDSFGNLKLEVDADGTETSHIYDRNGNRTETTTTRTAASGTETLTTRFVYDRAGRLVETRDPDGSRAETRYDALGKQVSTRDKLGRETSFTYDVMGRLEKTTFPDLTTEESLYDAEGRRLQSKDRAGRVTRFEYDAVGRLTRTTFPDDSFTLNEYDPAGRLVATQDANGNRTRFEYDDAGRRTKVIDALLQETVFGYDANGNQVSVRDPRLNTVRFEYDDLNRRVVTILPDQTEQRTEYDKLGRRTAEIDQAGRRTEFEYDGLGRLVKVLDAKLQETVYRYDEQGNRVAQVDANGNETAFEYDELGRQTKRTLPGGALETMTYDPAGNLETRTDFNGATTTFEYDANNRLTRRSYPDGSFVAFTYTATGRRETATDGRGVTSYIYDNRDRLETLTYSDGRKLLYDHDAQGNRTSLTAEIGLVALTTGYTYDELNRLDTVTDSEGRVYDHDYGPNGNRTKLSYPNGTETTYVYDDLNRLTNLTTINTSTLGMIQSYQYTLGAAGNRQRIDEHDGSVREYTYDELYRLTKETISDSVGLVYEKSFEYDLVGNRLSQTTIGTGAPGTPTAPGTIDYDHDTRDRILTKGTQVRTWDENGNLVTKDGEASYFWDFENRLVRAELADGTVVEHNYDVDGNRVRTITSPTGGSTQVRDFLVDVSGNPVSHVIVETDSSGDVVARYVRGLEDELLAVVRANGVRFYHADVQGSVRRLSDENGNITDGYSYTGFGATLGRTGSDPNPYLFTGEPLDANFGFYYHRARWRDLASGRFIALDPFEGLVFEPPTLHRYLYAENDPVNKSDPSGETTVQSSFVTLTINISINAISTVNPAAPLSGLASAVLTGAVDTFVPFRAPARVMRFAWKLAKPAGRNIWRFRGQFLVGFRSPIQNYGLLRSFTAGRGGTIQAHHILEARHLRRTWGWTEDQINTIAPAQILTVTQHQQISRTLLTLLPRSPRPYTKREIWLAYQEAYARFPGYLSSVRHLF